jgi:hypothetical protein
LQIERIDAGTRADEYVIVVKNSGDAPASGFWVDWYVDPVRAPAANDQWQDLCRVPWPNASCFGGAWFVSRTIAPGENMTLSTSDLIGDAKHSNWPGRFATSGAHTLYVYVDSYETNTRGGAITERDESNNRIGPVTVIAADR